MVAEDTMIAMILALLLMIILLVCAFFVLRRHFEMKVVPIFIGAFFFILFALVLEPKLHLLVLRPTATGVIPLKNDHPWLYVLYGVFAAGIFEETARFAGFQLLKKQYPKFDTSIAYGFGHGGIEVIMVGILSLVNSLVLALLVQNPNSELLQELPQIVLQHLQHTSASQIYLSVAERLAALVIQICLSILVWTAVNKKGRLGFYPLAILLHALIDVPAALLQTGLLKNVMLTQAILFLLTVVLLLLTRKFVIEKLDLA